MAGTVPRQYVAYHPHDAQHISLDFRMPAAYANATANGRHSFVHGRLAKRWGRKESRDFADCARRKAAVSAGSKGAGSGYRGHRQCPGIVTTTREVVPPAAGRERE